MNSERFRQVEELYHSVRELAPDTRGAFLAEACRGDEKLRREVESLLAQDRKAGPMEQPPLEVVAKLLADSMLKPLAAGTQLGPYRIECLLGAGGMGEVPRPRDAKRARDVAHKTLPKPFARAPERLALPARGAPAGLAEPSQHRGHSRDGGIRRPALPRDGVGPGGDARGRRSA